MKKSLRILEAVANRDLPDIIAYHQPKSEAKAVRILAEYDRFVELINRNPEVAHTRGHGWKVIAVQSGPYLLYYRDFESFWLVAGVFHAMRDPDWIQAQLLIREIGNI